MEPEHRLKIHLELCERIFERMQRDGSWPWRDSPNSEDLIESGDTEKDI